MELGEIISPFKNHKMKLELYETVSWSIDPTRTLKCLLLSTRPRYAEDSAYGQSWRL